MVGLKDEKGALRNGRFPLLEIDKGAPRNGRFPLSNEREERYRINDINGR